MRPNHRSIRSIPVSSGSHRRSTERDSGVHVPHRKKRSSPILWIGLGLVAICALAGLLLATLFEGATVTIVPKMQQVTPPSNLTALPNASAGSLSYQTVALANSATTTATASGTKQISKAASGVIVISNSFSAASQQLVAKTRFEAPDGKVYRIQSGVTIPGSKKAADGSTIPGTVNAIVYADVPGPTYNHAGQISFTIPGFKGDPRYTKITAKSQGDMAGGFVGDQPAVSDADMQTAQATLKKNLDASLKDTIAAQIPDGFLPVQGSLQVTYSDIRTTQVDSKTVQLTQSANASMAMVQESNLAGMLAKLLVQGYAGEPVGFASPNPLVLQLATSSASKTGPLALLLQGTPTIVWQFDQAGLKAKLLGTGKTGFQAIIDAYAPAIEKAQASIRPFWKATFPTDPEKLDIIIQQ